MYLPLYKVADTPFHIQDDELCQQIKDSVHTCVVYLCSVGDLFSITFRPYSSGCVGVSSNPVRRIKGDSLSWIVSCNTSSIAELNMVYCSV